MKLVMVENMDQVLNAALRRKPRPLKPNPAQAKGENQPKAPKTATKTPVFPPEQPPAVA